MAEMKKTLYKTDYSDKSIEEVKCTKFNEKSFWVITNGKAQRRNRFNTFEGYWATYDKAKKHLVEKAQKDINKYERMLTEAKQRLQFIDTNL